MRIPTTLVLSAFCLVASARSIHSRTDAVTNKHGSTRSLASRQHREPRALLDTCVYINTNLVLGVAAHVEVCLCLSALDLYLQTNVAIKLIIDLLGEDVVRARLLALINGSGSRHCSYPQHSHPHCTRRDPCDFTCDSPYVRDRNRCVCPRPYHECNGVCSMNACGSMMPRAPVESAANSKRSHGISSLVEAEATCLYGESVCGTSSGSYGFECLDVQTTKDSCGGCMHPNPFIESGHPPAGKDCSAIDGALNVECVHGQCIVQQCKANYAINRSGDGCVLNLDSAASSGFMDSGVYVEFLASALGLNGRGRKRDVTSTPSSVPELPKLDVPKPAKRSEEERTLMNADYRSANRKRGDDVVADIEAEVDILDINKRGDDDVVSDIKAKVDSLDINKRGDDVVSDIKAKLDILDINKKDDPDVKAKLDLFLERNGIDTL